MALRSLAKIYARRPKRYTPTRDGRSAGTLPAVPDTDSRSARSTGVVQPPRENEPATTGDQSSHDDASTAHGSSSPASGSSPRRPRLPQDTR